jgi:large subunit ribosomal protein L18
MDKREARQRRARQTRLRIAELRVKRLTVHRTNLHIYATIWSDDGQMALVQASTLEAEGKSALGGANGKGGNTGAAAMVGRKVAERAKAAGIESVAFDRSGFRFHGRVKALAEAAREAGLKF